MSIKTLAIALVVASPLGTFGADETVASLAHVEGNVLLSTGSEMASVKDPVRLVAGMRVLPTWRSNAVVIFDDGCTVRIDAGGRYVVERQSPCRRIATTDPDPKRAEAQR